jgi:hypothetical protein
MKQLLNFQILYSLFQILIDDSLMWEWLSKYSISNKEEYESRPGMKSMNLVFLNEYISFHLEFGNQTIKQLENQEIIRSRISGHGNWFEIISRIIHHMQFVCDHVSETLKDSRGRSDDFVDLWMILHWILKDWIDQLNRMEDLNQRWESEGEGGDWNYYYQSNLWIKYDIRNNE